MIGSTCSRSSAAVASVHPGPKWSESSSRYGSASRWASKRATVVFPQPLAVDITLTFLMVGLASLRSEEAGLERLLAGRADPICTRTRLSRDDLDELGAVVERAGRVVAGEA